MYRRCVFTAGRRHGRLSCHVTWFACVFLPAAVLTAVAYAQHSLGDDASQCPVCPVCAAPQATKCEKYTLLAVQLRWLKSAQFAGFYAAEELGFWDDECLEVILYQARFDYHPIAIWEHGATIAMPHYMQFLGHVAEGRDIMHVSQHFRRGGFAMWTSPVYEPEKTRSAETFEQLKGIKFGIAGWPGPGTVQLSALSLENKTACNYEDRLTMEIVPCRGDEDITFQRMGFGIQALMDASDTFEPVHAQNGMTYDQLGQLLATPVNGKLPVEGEDFNVYEFIDSGVYSLEDGIMVEKSWLEDPANEATMVKFLKGMHKGWIFCRDNEETCAGFVSPQGEETHQLYQMREVNKLVWPAPNGIGVHNEEEMIITQASGLKAGIFNETLPFPEHTTDKYAVLANKELTEEGYDVEGLYFDQPRFQARLSFCLNDNGVAAICPDPSTQVNSTSTTNEAPSRANITILTVLLAVVCLTMLVFVPLFYSRWKGSLPYKNMMMRRTPPGMLVTGSPVTMVITDIENSTSLWDCFPEEMAIGQEMHDSCLRAALNDCFGYEVYTEGDSFTVTFHEADDALMWCSLVQQRLHNLSWPSALQCLPPKRVRAGPDVLLGTLCAVVSRDTVENMLDLMETQANVDATAIPADSNSGREFCGLRIRMGVHTAHVADVQRHATTNRVIYPHDFIHETSLVQDAPCGGQIVLSADTVSALTRSEESSRHGTVVHLGAHLLEAADPCSSSTGSGQGLTKDLFMLVPHALSDRVVYYPPLSTLKQVSLGYMQAPGKNCVTIVFCSIQRLRSIRADMPEDAAECIEMVSQCARELLPKHNGYECEERDGSFMLAFHKASEAMLWSLDLQEQLLKMEWSEELLSHPACERCMMLDAVMFNGPRMKIGMASGAVIKTTPSQTTGRADYFGPLLNHAARVKNHAAGGQVVVDKASWESAKDNSSAALRGDCLGSFEFKGLKQALEVYQVSMEESALRMRTFPVARPVVKGQFADDFEQEDAKKIAGLGVAPSQEFPAVLHRNPVSRARARKSLGSDHARRSKTQALRPARSYRDLSVTTTCHSETEEAWRTLSAGDMKGGLKLSAVLLDREVELDLDTRLAVAGGRLSPVSSKPSRDIESGQSADPTLNTQRDE